MRTPSTFARVSYDIYFLSRRPGESWEEAMDALEEAADGPEVLDRPTNWDAVVAGVRGILGDVTVLENPPAWEIDDGESAIQVSCFSGEWSVSVPFWSDGEAAVKTAGRLRRLAELISGATGLEAYDPQIDDAVLSDQWNVEGAASIFDQVAEGFDRRGIKRG